MTKVQANPKLGVQIRDYRPEDFETLWRIDQECFPPGISYSCGELERYVQHKRSFTLLAEVDGRIAGFIVAARERKDVGHIITLDISAQFRRSGLGSKLMAAAEERLRAAGCTFVFLETAVDNTAAIAFYKRLGYSVINAIPRYYLGSVDALVLAKYLA
ncbi:MAG TPA: N-acetyltransferase [Terriglobales bacterium]|nr:N-acetyltransferase [Terriglobales bacterium]